MNGDFVFRLMTRSEIRLLIDWAAAEGWNPGLHDADTFWHTDPEGFLGIILDGKFIGGGAIVRHNSQFGFMGLFILDPAYRGQGLGQKLWLERRNRLLGRLSTNACIGLDAVDHMIPFYEKGGFKKAFRHVRYSWDNEAPTVDARSMPIDLNAIPFDQLIKFDANCFVGGRDQFLRSWVSQPGAHKLGAIKSDKLRGYGVVRPCRKGWKIGPLLAKDQSIAVKLLKSLVTLGVPGPVYLDVPENNQLALDMCDRLGMTAGCHCTRMYYGTPPQVEQEFIYGAATMELG